MNPIKFLAELHDKGESLYCHIHGSRRWRQTVREQNIVKYRQNAFKMLVAERKVQADYKAETQRLAQAVRLAMKHGLSEADAVQRVAEQ